MHIILDYGELRNAPGKNARGEHLCKTLPCRKGKLDRIEPFARTHPRFSHAMIDASSRPLEIDCHIPRFFCPRLSRRRLYCQFNFRYSCPKNPSLTSARREPLNNTPRDIPNYFLLLKKLHIHAPLVLLLFLEVLKKENRTIEY